MLMLIHISYHLIHHAPKKKKKKNIQQLMLN